MEYIGYILIGVGVLVCGWMFWGLILFPSGKVEKTKKTSPAMPVVKAENPRPQNTEAMDRLWFFDPKTKALVDKARNELPLLYSKMQVLQQQLVGAKVDMNREEGTLMQNNMGDGILGLLVTGVAAHGMAKSREKQDELRTNVEKLQKQIDEDEALISRYDNLAVKFARG